MPDVLFHIADKQGIEVEFWNFEPPLEGVYLAHYELPPYIGIDYSLRSDKVRLRCILAEELGHHFTSAGSAIPSDLYLFRDRLWTSRIEYRAMKWAAEHLLPRTKMLNAFHMGLYQPWEIAEYYGVTNDMVSFRMQLPDMIETFNNFREAL